MHDADFPLSPMGKKAPLVGKALKDYSMGPPDSYVPKIGAAYKSMEYPTVNIREGLK